MTSIPYERGLAGDVSDAEYVETVGVIATVIAIGNFCDALRVATPRVAGTHRRWASPSTASRGEGMGAGRLIPLQRNIKEPDWRPMASETTNPPS